MLICMRLVMCEGCIECRNIMQISYQCVGQLFVLILYSLQLTILKSLLYFERSKFGHANDAQFYNHISDSIKTYEKGTSKLS